MRRSSTVRWTASPDGEDSLKAAAVAPPAPTVSGPTFENPFFRGPDVQGSTVSAGSPPSSLPRHASALLDRDGEWVALLERVRDGLAQIAAVPRLTSDPQARAILGALGETPEHNALDDLDAYLDALLARVDELTLAGTRVRHEPGPPPSPVPHGSVSVREVATVGSGRRILIL